MGSGPTREKTGSLIMAYQTIWQFKLTLIGITPTIWRRMQVPETYTLWDLHVAIQDAMGWKDCHLHAFRMTNAATGELDLIGIPDDEGFVGDPEYVPGWEIPIADYFSLDSPNAVYEYDFGDSWEHEVTFEETLPRNPAARYPVCVDGERACPPEDCGGIPGYENLLRILNDTSHEEHKSMRAWLGGEYDPQRFDHAKLRFDDPRQRWRASFEAS